MCQICHRFFVLIKHIDREILSVIMAKFSYIFLVEAEPWRIWRWAMLSKKDLLPGLSLRFARGFLCRHEDSSKQSGFLWFVFFTLPLYVALYRILV